MVSQRSSGGRTLDQRELARRRAVPTEPAPFPRELARCRCGTPSFDAAHHANGCPLGLTPPLSTNPTVADDTGNVMRQGF